LYDNRFQEKKQCVSKEKENGPFLLKHQPLQEPYSTVILENSLPAKPKGEF
jgi:hypothetical protein